MKRKILLSIVLISITVLTFGQNFGVIGTQWYYSEHAGGTAPPNSEYVHYESVEDTVINGMTTHKIIRTYYKHNGDSVFFDPLYVYEMSDTVFMYNFQKAKFQTIYIFNALQGDTLTLDNPDTLSWTTDSTYRLIIDTIEVELVDGIPLKKYRTIPLDEFQFYNGGYFMDKVGGLDWFFPRATIIPEAGGPIRCYFDSQIDTIFQTVACDYRLIASLNGVSIKNIVKIYPNPASGILYVQTEKPIDKIELTDLTSKRLITSTMSTLDLNGIKNGFYIVTIYFKDGQRTDMKIIKNAL